MGETNMATKRKAAPGLPKAKAQKKGLGIAITLKGSPEWKAWVDGMATEFRTDTAKLVDMALVEFAKAHGLGPAPRR